MRICVVGAGAIGGYMVVRLAAAGHDVSVIARGPHLDAIRTNGLKLIEADGGAEQARRNGTHLFRLPRVIEKYAGVT